MNSIPERVGRLEQRLDLLLAWTQLSVYTQLNPNMEFERFVKVIEKEHEFPHPGKESKADTEVTKVGRLKNAKNHRGPGSL